MKALILNSGIGTRMKELTAETCKCLVELTEGVTILDIQLKALYEAGIMDVCITTGPNAQKLERYVEECFPEMRFCFVHNPIYNQTNYIYSIHLAREALQDDILLLHGDLVFEGSVLEEALLKAYSVMVTDSTRALPPKDFKAVIFDEKVRRIGVDEFGEGACYAQPLYKLLKEDWLVWLDEINRFCLEGNVNVYAENAFNGISHNMNLYPLDIKGRVCFEIDNMEDLVYGKKMYQQFLKPAQRITEGVGSISKLESIIHDLQPKRIFAVGGWGLKELATRLPLNTVYFNDFTPNPDYEEVIKGISLFDAEKCDLMISIGGGSAIDIAKCVNILDGDEESLLDEPRCKHIAIPTTAGTGSESTCFAVIYKNDEKLSIEHPELLPEYVILDSELLRALPMYHKKSTLLDALCQAIESIWAKAATAESKRYAKEAISLILNNIDSYLAGSEESAKHMLKAANLSGKAINISKTTAPHAMSYKLSNILGIAHGHAVALCLPHVWKHLIDEGIALKEISCGMGVASSTEALDMFVLLLGKLELPLTFEREDSVIQELIDSVNPQRLSNHPLLMTDDVLADIYRKII